MVSEDGDQLRLRQPLWWLNFNWRAEILQVHYLQWIWPLARLNSTLPCAHWILWILHKPAHPGQLHSNNFIITAVNTVMVSVSPSASWEIQISVFELVSLKTTHSSTWCQICCKTWIWATHRGRCQLQGVHPIKVDEPRKPHSQWQMMPRWMTSTFSPPTTLPRWEMFSLPTDKYQKPHVLVAKLFIIYTRTCSGSYAISWLECRQTNMFDAKTVILYWTSNVV